MEYKYPILRKIDVLHKDGKFYDKDSREMCTGFDNIHTITNKVCKEFDFISGIRVKRLKNEKRSVYLRCCGLYRPLDFTNKDIESFDIFIPSYPLIYTKRIGLTFHPQLEMKEEVDKEQFEGYQVDVTGYKNKFIHNITNITNKGMYVEFDPECPFYFIEKGCGGWTQLYSDLGEQTIGNRRLGTKVVLIYW
jgi:hypothetical protein